MRWSDVAYALASRLERAVKRAGVKYRAQSGWRNRGRGRMGSIQSIMAHHTAGPASGNTPSLNVVTHGRPGLSGPLAQIFLARDGTVILVAAGRANHAGRVSSNRYSNSHSIGIEAEATGVSSWPAVQVDAYAKLCKALIDEFKLPVSRVVGHKEAAVPRGRKIDPNFSMSDFRRKVGGAKGGVSQDGGSGGTTYTTVTGSTPLVRLYHKGDPVRRIQKAVGITVDGYYGPNTKNAVQSYQRKHGLAADGIVGPATWAKINGGKPAPKPKPKTPAFPLPSGHWYGTESSNPKNHSGYYQKDRAGIRQLQQGLKDRNWKINVDGIYGPATRQIVTSFQRKAGIRVDGAVGAQTWNAIFSKPLMKR